MTKQEEIREGVKGLLYAMENNRDLLGRKNQALEFANKIIKYLSHQGVVIKVERELGTPPANCRDWSAITMQEVEPLI